MTITEKQCFGPCKQVKPLEAFTKQKAGLAGHTSRCKECQAANQAYRAAKPVDKFFEALEKHKKSTGRQYSTMTDAWYVMTVIMGYKPPDL